MPRPGLAQPVLETPEETPPCLELGPSLMTIAGDVEDVELERARVNGLAAVKALECQQEPLDSMLLTNLLQLVGAVQLYSGDANGAQELFAWAITSSPNMVLSPSYGDEAVQLYRGIQVHALSIRPASLTVTGKDVQAWVNGSQLVVGEPQNLMAGTHLLQWRLNGGPMTIQVIDLLAGEPRKLPLAPEDAVPVQPLAEVESKPDLTQTKLPSSGRMLFIGTGVASITGGSILVVLAARSHEDFFKETDPDDLPELQTRTNALASTGLVMVAGGLALGSFSFSLSGSF